MNNQIQLVLKSSTTELSLNDRELGIYLVPELEGLTGLPEIRTTSGVNAGYDGGWTSAQNYDARSITIRGVIANTDVATVERLRRQLTALAGQGKKEELTLDLVTEAGNAYTVQVRTIALEMALQKVVYQQEFMLQLRADDPLIYDASETGHETLLQVAQATGGFTIDFELPLAITGSSEETVVNNEGLEQVPTITRMYGALHNPKIINQTTNQFMQIEADLGFAEGDWIEPSEVVSGKDITINGAPEGAPFSKLDLKGNTEQTTYSGKNLYCVKTRTVNGITMTVNADGSFNLSGTATATVYMINETKPISLMKNGATYTCWANSNIPSGVDVRLGVDNEGAWVRNLMQAMSGSTTTRTFTANTSGGDAIRCEIYVPNGTTVNISNMKIQLEAGSSATSFEPFTAGPAPNPDYPQAVQTVTGENTLTISDGTNTQSYPVNLTPNLYDYGDRKKGYYIDSNGDEVSNSAWSITDYLPVVAGNIFGCSGMTNAGNAPRGAYYDSSKNLVSVFKQTTGNNFITIPSGVAFVRFSLNGYENDQTADWLKFKFFYDLELCKIGTYQDYIYKSGDKWYKHAEIGKTDLANYSYVVASSILRRTTAIPNMKYVSSNTQVGSAIAEKYIIHEGRGMSAASLAGYMAIDVSMFAVNVGTSDTSVNPTGLLYYALATPTDTEITNEALVAQLEALAAATMYNPQTNITTLHTDGNEQPTLDVSYFTDKNPDTRDELIIDSRLRTITLNGLDVYHLQAPGSEFLMLAPGENRLALQSDITGDNGYAQVSYKQGYLSI